MKRYIIIKHFSGLIFYIKTFLSLKIRIHWALNTLLFPQNIEIEPEEEPISKITDSIIPERQEVPSKVPKSTQQCPNDDSKKVDTKKSKQIPEHIIKKQEQFKDTDDETDLDITPSDEVNKDENKFYTINVFYGNIF